MWAGVPVTVNVNLKRRFIDTTGGVNEGHQTGCRVHTDVIGVVDAVAVGVTLVLGATGGVNGRARSRSWAGVVRIIDAITVGIDVALLLSAPLSVHTRGSAAVRTNIRCVGNTVVIIVEL